MLEVTQPVDAEQNLESTSNYHLAALLLENLVLTVWPWSSVACWPQFLTSPQHHTVPKAPVA